MVKNSIDQLAENLENFITSLPSQIFNLFNEILNNVKDTLINVKDAIINLPNTIVNLLKSMLEFLFVPSDEVINNLLDTTREKFGFINQIIDLGAEITNVQFDDKKPSFTVVLYGKEYEFINLSMFDQYRSLIHTYIIAISYFMFVLWLIHNIPNVLSGFSNFTDTTPKEGA